MGQEVNFNAKVEAFMKANPGVSKADAEKAVREQEQAQLTAGVSGNKNEGNFGSEGALKEPKEESSGGGWVAAFATGAAVVGGVLGFIKGRNAKAAAAGATLGVAAATTLGLQSCVEQKGEFTAINDNKETNELLATLIAKFDKVRDDIKDWRNQDQKNFDKGVELANRIIELLKEGNNLTQEQTTTLKAELKAILSTLVDGNSWLEAIYNKAVDNGEQNDKILAELKEIKGQINNLIDITSKLPDNVKEALGPDFQAVVAAINNNTKSVNEIKTLMKAAVLKLHVLIMQNDVQIRQNATQIKQLFEILKKLGNIEVSLGDIKNAIKEINGNFSAVLANLDKVTTNQDEQTDILNQILLAIGNMDAGTQDKLSAILNAIIANGGKVEDLKDILNMINNNVVADTEQSKKNTQAIIDAMNRVGANVIVAIRQSNDGLAALFDKVIAAINNNTFNDSVNTNKILDAIKNIKIDGGQVDLSSLEAMMRQLLALTAQNGNILSSIDAKMDIANATLEAILAKIPEAGEYEAQLNAILNAIAESKYDDSEMLNRLDQLINIATGSQNQLIQILQVCKDNNAVLQKILDAIKNHKVDVNVIVECVCNCINNGNNEGIIKEIESLIE